MKQKWLEKYYLAKKYYEHYGHLNIPYDFKTSDGVTKDENGINLGSWVREQRRARQRKTRHQINDEQIELLDSIGIIWDIRNNPHYISNEWKEKYNLAKKYYEHYGHLSIPSAFQTKDGITKDANGIYLGSWIQKQRQAKYSRDRRKINEEQIKLLDSIGMIWEVKSDPNYISVNWDSYYDLAKKYYEHYGHLQIPGTFKTKDGINPDENGLFLGSWIFRQRRAKLKKDNYAINETQIKKLDSIGMVWEIRQDPSFVPVNWKRNYDLAKKYYEHYGHLKIPTGFKTKDGISFDNDGIGIGDWITNQRSIRKGYGSGSLNEEQIKLLDEIGMLWSDVNQVFAWDYGYNLALKYFSHYGNLDVNINFKTKNGIDYDENGFGLGKWISVLRRIRRGGTKGNLSNDQIKSLDMIGMNWVSADERNWLKMYKLALEYYQKHGNLLVSTFNTTGEERTLALWIKYQRSAYVNNKLPEERIKLLERIGMQWVLVNPLDRRAARSWMESYELAKTYYEHYGNLAVPSNFKTNDGITFDETGYDLGKWMATQRLARKEIGLRRITDEKIKLLDAIGMIWDKHEDNWKAMYELAKKYYEHYGNLAVPSNFKTNDGITFDESGYNLGQWISAQRSFKKGTYQTKINDERVELLDNIGMIWDMRIKKSEIENACSQYGINYNTNRKVLKCISPMEFEVKLAFLRDSGIPYVNEKGKLHNIFSMSSVDMKRVYGVSLVDLIDAYGKKETK